MDNLTLVALFIMVLWLAAIGYYLYTSRQQEAISHEIDELREMVGSEGDHYEG